MRYTLLLPILYFLPCLGYAQNVGIGTTAPTENLHVVGNKSLFENNYVGIGVGNPATAFTSLQINKNVNSYLGMYINSGATGTPFYGYALNGLAKAYTSFNSTNNQFEYHQTGDATPDFLINGNTKAVFNTNFVGIGTGTPTTSYTGFAMKNNVNSFYGSYIDAGATGVPFYGYALNGVPKAYSAFNGTTNQFEYHQSSDGTPDFLINGNSKAVFNTGFVGIGTSTPTTSFTGFALKSPVNAFYGMYVDAGATGAPFYGYALNGVPRSYTSFNSTANQFEYHQSSDATPDFLINGNTKAVFNTDYVCVGTNTQLNSFTGLTLKKDVNTFYGMYVDAGATGSPFYGYALDGSAKAYTQINGNTNNWELVTSTTALIVTPSGNIGIGANPMQKLDVGGVIHALNLNGGATTLSTDAAGNIIRTPSDATLKMEVSDITDAVTKVKRMHGVTYTFIDKKRFGINRQMGFLAQELEQVVPEAVSSGGEYKSVNYQVLTALLTEAVKEQQEHIETQKKENEVLKKQVELLMQRVEKLEKKS